MIWVEGEHKDKLFDHAVMGDNAKPGCPWNLQKNKELTKGIG
jgi:hypothetical protein